MIWIAFAVIILICLLIFFKRRNSFTLTNDQVELVKELIHKEMNNLETERQNIIEGAAANGKTIPTEKLFYNIQDQPEPVKIEMERIKKELLKKYGENIPVDIVYRLSKQFDPKEESVWSDNPGCFERHLQRREGNTLFPPERRIISIMEIKDAQKKDRIEQEQFVEKANSFVEQTKSIGETIGPDQAFSIFKDVQSLIEEAVAIGGAMEPYIQALENTEIKIIDYLSKAVPDGDSLLKKARSLSMLKRSSYVAQSSREDSPILKDETIPTLLSEDFETIALEGYKSRAFAPDYRPNETDIRKFLENAVKLGFSKEAADQIISALNET